MCRNIRPLFNFEPPATEAEIEAASLQFVRKISGYQKPSQVNQEAFERAVADIAAVFRAVARFTGDIRATAQSRRRIR